MGIAHFSVYSCLAVRGSKFYRTESTGGFKCSSCTVMVRKRTLEKGKARLQSAGVEPYFNRDPVTRQPLAFSTAAPEPPPRPRRQGDGRFNSGPAVNPHALYDTAAAAAACAPSAPTSTLRPGRHCLVPALVGWWRLCPTAGRWAEAEAAAAGLRRRSGGEAAALVAVSAGKQWPSAEALY